MTGDKNHRAISDFLTRLSMLKIKDYSLYLVISEEYGKGRSAFEMAESAIKGGVDIIQMREKNMPKDKLVDIGKRLSCLCLDSGVMFIVNDDPELAKEVDADGVHLGQDDIKKYPIDKTRKTLKPDKIIGISTHSLEQFSRANNEGFDYIAFGPIFPTKTKDYFLGTGGIKDILNIAARPVFFIGGISLSNIDGLLEAGAKNIALIRGITEAEDIVSAAGEFKNRLQNRDRHHFSIRCSA